MTEPMMSDAPPHRITVVIPVYQGATTIATVIDELAAFTTEFETPDGHLAKITEVILVNDNGPDRSDIAMREAAATHSWVRTLWLSRNYGQHAATLAGMASSGGDWVVTMDEDGQHDPGYIGAMLDVAMSTRAEIVYGEPTNKPPHGWLRNIASRGAKRVIEQLLGGTDTSKYQSFRLILGEIARSTAAFAGANAYLDVALGWVAGEAKTCPMPFRQELGRASGYSLRRLMSHFWRMVLSSGTRGLRAVSFLGVSFAAFGIILAAFLTVQRLGGAHPPDGWTSTTVIVLLSTGAVLFSLGVIAEYVGVAVNMAMGKPAYLIVSDPASGPHGRPAHRQ